MKKMYLANRIAKQYILDYYHGDIMTSIVNVIDPEFDASLEFTTGKSYRTALRDARKRLMTWQLPQLELAWSYISHPRDTKILESIWNQSWGTN